MIDIHDADLLTDQLIYRIGPQSDRKIAFVVGAGLTQPSIPGVAEYIQAMRSSLEQDTARIAGLKKTLDAFDGAVDGRLPSVSYQRATSFIQGSRGHERLNEIIRLGVLRACQRDDLRKLTRAEAQRLVMDEVALENLESDADWKLTEGVAAFGRVLTAIRDAGKSGPVITTNFDPLIELAVQRAGGQFDTQSMDSTDGRIPPSLQPSAISVIHVHGYWRQGETLHTQYQLSRTRTKLAASLEERLRGNYVVVVAYGGWRDVFTKCLMGFLNKGNCMGMTLSWGWHGEQEQKDFRTGIKAQLAKLSCVSHYSRIDTNVLFPDVLKGLDVVP
jgi:hypothetical protein